MNLEVVGGNIITEGGLTTNSGNELRELGLCWSNSKFDSGAVCQAPENTDESGERRGSQLMDVGSTAGNGLHRSLRSCAVCRPATRVGEQGASFASIQPEGVGEGRSGIIHGHSRLMYRCACTGGRKDHGWPSMDTERRGFEIG